MDGVTVRRMEMEHDSALRIAEEHKRLARRAYGVLSTGAVDELDQVVAPEFVDHRPDGTRQGLAELKAQVAELRAGFPDLVCSIDELTAQGERVAVQYRLSGRHRGTYQGAPATGKRIAVESIDILRIAGGKVVERWTQPDDLRLYQQIGVVPTVQPRY